MIEEILSGEAVFKVGVAELSNEGHRSKNELIKTVTADTTGLIAVALLNPENIAGPLHLVAAAENALNAWRGGYAVAKMLDVEIIRFASGQRQISRALETFGLHDDILPSVAVVVLGTDEQHITEWLSGLKRQIGPEIQPPFSADWSRIRRVMSLFNISETELRAIADSDALPDLYNSLTRCVAERVALVAVED